MLITGILEKITENPTQFGVMYSIKVGGKNYGLGKTKPAASEGQTVSFTASKNDRGYFQAEGLKVSTGTPATSQTTGSFNNNPNATRGGVLHDIVSILTSDANFNKANIGAKRALVEEAIRELSPVLEGYVKNGVQQSAKLTEEDINLDDIIPA